MASPRLRDQQQQQQRRMKSAGSPRTSTSSLAMRQKRPRQDILATLKNTQIEVSRPRLPMEMFNMVLQHLSPPDMIRLARCCRLLREMVYEDARWVRKLVQLGCWDEAEAARLRRAAQLSPPVNRRQTTDGSNLSALRSPGQAFGKAHTAATERQSMPPRQQGADDGSGSAGLISPIIDGPGKFDPRVALYILKTVRSVPGLARQEYGRVHAALATLYDDITSNSNSNSGGGDTPRDDNDGISAPSQYLVFKLFDAPEDQAQALANLTAFARSDDDDEGTAVPGARQRRDKLAAAVDMFRTAALREFRFGYEAGDADGLMRKYARVLALLDHGHDGTAAAVDLFIEHNYIITHKGEYGSPMDCISMRGERETGGAVVSLEHTRAFLTRLHAAFNHEFSIMERSFGPCAERSKRLIRKIANDMLAPYMATLFDEVHARNVDAYLRTVGGTFDQVDRFLHELQPIYNSAGDNSGDEFEKIALEVQLAVYEPHLDLYLAEEMRAFEKFCESTVFAWDQQLSRQEESAEMLYMSNINRQADKRDFLGAFKKVLTNPASMFPNFSSSSSSSSSNKPVPGKHAITSPKTSSLSDASVSSTSLNMASPRIGSGSTNTPDNNNNNNLPTTELAAKAAIMNSKLESIRSLFSIEVALRLVQAAKTSLERTAQFVKLGGRYGSMAREQCETVFVSLLHNLGHRHVVTGFVKAIDRLSVYRDKKERQSHHDHYYYYHHHHSQIISAVDSLVKFLELVNVGDLILQMLNVFYEQELIGAKLTTYDDFLAASAKEKKRLEQILDENVALGLTKGIDVLMDHVDYALATKQQSAHFNPEGARAAAIASSSSSSSASASSLSAAAAAAAAAPVVADVGPSEAAREVVDIITSHTRMLVGNTDKGTFDVFNAEIGSRLFTSLCKHIKRQRISVGGAVKLISDMNYYFAFVQGLRNDGLTVYFAALRELAQVYLINSADSREMAAVITDVDRFHGVFRSEEVYEFATRRADWYQVKTKVDSAMFGIGCSVM